MKQNQLELPSWIKPSNFKVTAFYPYTSRTRQRLFEQDHNYENEFHDALEQFGSAIKEMALQEIGVKWDNKVVVEIQSIAKEGNPRDTTLFVGFYDGVISIGLSMNQDDWLEKNNCNLRF